MLEEKFDMLLLAVYNLRKLTSTTVRHVSEVRGKVLHYGQAVPYLAICAPSLYQLIHHSSCAPSLAEEAELQFNWDQVVIVTSRAALACDLSMAAMWSLRQHDGPLWPLVPSSVYGGFLEGSTWNSSELTAAFHQHHYAEEILFLQSGHGLTKAARCYMDFSDPTSLFGTFNFFCL